MLIEDETDDYIIGRELYQDTDLAYPKSKVDKIQYFPGMLDYDSIIKTTDNAESVARILSAKTRFTESSTCPCPKKTTITFQNTGREVRPADTCYRCGIKHLAEIR